MMLRKMRLENAIKRHERLREKRRGNTGPQTEPDEATEALEMAQDKEDPSRRRVLQTAVAVLCCGSAGVDTANASQHKIVDQITDPTTTAAKNMFRFEPNFVELSPGDELVFLNSTAEHTVHSVKQLWPSGSPLVKISNRKEVKVRFDREGFYGFRCRRHGPYGMVMLVVVGKPQNAPEIRSIVETMPAKARERSGFMDLLNRFERV